MSTRKWVDQYLFNDIKKALRQRDRYINGLYTYKDIENKLGISHDTIQRVSKASTYREFKLKRKVAR